MSTNLSRKIRTLIPKPQILRGIVLLLMVFSGACGGRSLTGLNDEDIASTTCNPNVAQIQVWDGLLQIMCGCSGPNEAPGTVFSHPGNLTCHLAASDTVVLFSFLGDSLRHQIIPDGGEQFVPTPVVNPRNGNNVLIHAIGIPRGSTTYYFQDAFSGLKGSIIVP